VTATTPEAAAARLGVSFMRAQQAIQQRMIDATNAAADVLDALTDTIESDTEWPALDELIRAAIHEANVKVPKLICATCLRTINGPMIATANNRVEHYPECPPKVSDLDAVLRDEPTARKYV